MAVTEKSNGLSRDDMHVAAGPHQGDSDDIRRDIDRTRTEMDRTIDELGARLQPRSLFDDLVASVRDSLFARSDTARHTTGQQRDSQQFTDAAGTIGRNLVESIRENPVPAALMGAGLAWLLFEDKAERMYRRRRLAARADDWDELKHQSGSFVDARTGKPYSDDYGAGYEDIDGDGEPDIEPQSLKDKVGSAAGSVKHAVQEAAGAISHAAGKTAQSMKDAAHKTGDAVDSTKQSMRDYRRSMGRSVRRARVSAGARGRRTADSMNRLGHQTSEAMERFGHDAAEKTRAGYAVSRDRFNHALDEQPLALGVAALAVGLVAGFAWPRTRTEDRMIGRRADTFRDEARRQGREAIEQGREVASHLADEALADAESQGLSPETLGSKVARVADDAMHAARDSARREGIDSGSLADKARHVGQSVKEKGEEEVSARTGRTNEQPANVASGSSTLPATGETGISDTTAEEDHSGEGRTC